MRTVALRRALCLAAVAALLSGGIANAGVQSSTHHHKAKHHANRIHIAGSTHNTFGSDFTERVFGHAKGKANYVDSSEIVNPSQGCAKSYKVESRRSDWSSWPDGGVGSVHGKFSLVAHFTAAIHGSHSFCSYLINSSTHKTFAHARQVWTNT